MQRWYCATRVSQLINQHFQSFETSEADKRTYLSDHQDTANCSLQMTGRKLHRNIETLKRQMNGQIV